MRVLRATHGQATIEYVALVAVLGLLLAVGATLATVGAPGIVNAVVAQVRHALCLVGGGPCADPRPQPCTVQSMREEHHLAVNLGLVRADQDRYLLRERMSDGSVRLTVGNLSAAGVEVGVGATVKAAFKGRRVGAADEERAALQGVLGSGRVFIASDDRQADAFARAIGDGRAPPAPVREVFAQGGVRGLARLGIGSWIAGASLDGLAGAMIGARRDRSSGETTFALDLGSTDWAAVSAAFGGPVALADRATGVALTVDARRRPRELSLTSAGTLAAGATLPPALARILGRVDDPAQHADGRRLELSARLDLLDPVVAGTWARFRHDPTSGAAIRALGRTLAERAQLDARIYDASSSVRGVVAGLAFGVRVGGELERTTDRNRLRAAYRRAPGGLWEPRLDCVA